MQMDKRNQIGCEDTTELSKEGVVLDLRALKGSQSTALPEVELVPCLPAGLGLEGLSAPGLKVTE
jgi:hypothetical protein